MPTQIGVLKAAAATALASQVYDDANATAADRQQTGQDVTSAQAAKTDAETARDAAFTGANVYDDTSAGLAATAVGDQFHVVADEIITRYEHMSGGTADAVATMPAALFSHILQDAIGDLSSVLGQVSRQVNGGRADHTGGTLADPALRIGTVGIYSSAADTLSIAIGGTEVARFDASGLTVYGTVTQS